MEQKEQIKNLYDLARKEYASLGVDTDRALDAMKEVQISLHCWQTDDVGGFETPDAVLGGGGIQATGNYPGKAKTIQQVKQDIEKVMELLPGKQRFNLHAIYGDFGGQFVDRDQIEVRHFQTWIDWAKEQGIGLDFNCTCFSHPKAEAGFTLSSKDEKIRKFWVEHTRRCRKIGAEMGKQLGTPCVHNIWVPDGSKDIPVDRFTHRALLKKSLDEIFSDHYPKTHLKDSVESKLFGIGLEAMTVGSHDFYLGYAIRNDKLICLDSGHFHPTEQVGDKISACLQFVDELMLHVTRPIRWDSDHVVTLNDDVLLIAQEIVRSNALKRVNFGLDFFDASMNRIGAYVIGTRAAQQAMLFALLEPIELLKKYENEEKSFERLAVMELMKTKPFGAVWNYYCQKEGVPVGEDYIKEIQAYEKSELSKR
ncbi:MAG: L-rhamnose isomerase [Bacteroidales bacterium]|nr:L-rhamnose isomerase [Bacteroidales bacterium]MBN2697244.1 L-rhamnose isomerase [Bacteroidales bacterium]